MPCPASTSGQESSAIEPEKTCRTSNVRWPLWPASAWLLPAVFHLLMPQLRPCASRPFPTRHLPQDRKSVVWGKRVSVRVDIGGRRIIKKKNTPITEHITI